MPWARALDMLEKGQIDILPAVWLTEERTQSMNYSDHYAKNRLVFIKAKNSDYEFNGLPSLYDKVVGVVRDYAYEENFINDQSIEFSIANNLESNVKKVIAAELITVDDEIAAKASITPSLLEKIEFTENPLSELPLYITCSKQHTNCSRIIEDFNLGLKKMQQDGSLDTLLNSQK